MFGYRKRLTKSQLITFKEGKSMQSVKILIDSEEKVKDFNRRIGRYNCDFDLEVGRDMVDAKSLLGIFTLTLNKPIMLHIHAEEEMLGEIKEDISMYCIA